MQFSDKAINFRTSSKTYRKNNCPQLQLLKNNRLCFLSHTLLLLPLTVDPFCYKKAYSIVIAWAFFGHMSWRDQRMRSGYNKFDRSRMAALAHIPLSSRIIKVYLLQGSVNYYRSWGGKYRRWDDLSMVKAVKAVRRGEAVRHAAELQCVWTLG